MSVDRIPNHLEIRTELEVPQHSGVPNTLAITKAYSKQVQQLEDSGHYALEHLFTSESKDAQLQNIASLFGIPFTGQSDQELKTDIKLSVSSRNSSGRLSDLEDVLRILIAPDKFLSEFMGGGDVVLRVLQHMPDNVVEKLKKYLGIAKSGGNRVLLEHPSEDLPNVFGDLYFLDQTATAGQTQIVLKNTEGLLPSGKLFLDEGALSEVVDYSSIDGPVLLLSVPLAFDHVFNPSISQFSPDGLVSVATATTAIAIGDTAIDVQAIGLSTISLDFPPSGKLNLNYGQNPYVEVNYSSIAGNSFLGVSGVTQNLPIGSHIVGHSIFGLSEAIEI